MPIVDVLLLSIVLTFTVLGFAFGFLHTFGSLIGAAAGIFIGSRVSGNVAEQFGMAGGGGQVFVFIVIFILVSRIVGVLFWVAQKVWDLMAFIPFAGMFDRLFGALLGILEGVMIAGVIVFYAIQILPEEAMKIALEHSWLATQLLRSVSFLQLLFPEELRTALNM